MKRITVVGLTLLLLSGIVSGGRAKRAEIISLKTKPAVYKSGKRTSEFSAFAKKETRRIRSKNRRKVLRYSGKWTGKLYQPKGPVEQKFNFSLTLYQKGKTVTGFSRIAVVGSPEYYGVMRLRGRLKRNRLI